MSESSLLRHYTAAVGTTPARTVERLRVEAARLLLGDTDRPVKEIAGQCGFGSDETMRRGLPAPARGNPTGLPRAFHRDRSRAG